MASDMEGYNQDVDAFRETEFPMLKGENPLPSPDAVTEMRLKGVTYLDHAGTTLYPKSLIDEFSKDMMTDILGNPHSASMSSQRSSQRVENVRLRVLHFLSADPNQFDVVFVANATAGIKIVMEAFRENQDGFWYGYHKDSHTSLVGVREAAAENHCFISDQEVEGWLSGQTRLSAKPREWTIGLFAYPAQSNLNGRRLPLSWPGRLRSSKYPTHRRMYTLLDAAALLSTSALDLRDAPNAPDFTVLSFYKVFGFPDLGALIVRKDSGHLLRKRSYFGGGTVEMVACVGEQWHVRKESYIHERWEDGTLPYHSIIALDSAFSVHERLFGTLGRVSSHASYLAQRLHKDLEALHHSNGAAVCQIYKTATLSYADMTGQGPIIAFNIRNSQGGWVSNAEVEKLAGIKNIHLRSGGLCNPGGIATYLDLTPREMKRNLSAGQRCGNENDIMDGKPVGVVRISLGAMSNLEDVSKFLDFMREFFVEEDASHEQHDSPSPFYPTCHVESLTIYPIKSCGGWRIPPDLSWQIKPEGLAWDREWCLVHPGTKGALSQKRHPKMALLKPSIDLDRGLLRVRYHGRLNESAVSEIAVPLSIGSSTLPPHQDISKSTSSTSRVCGDTVMARAYTSNKVSAFFTDLIGTPCMLVRFPADRSGATTRHSKPNMRPLIANPLTSVSAVERPLLLSNESPILTISRSSLNRLNEVIKSTGGKAAHAEVFRANIVIAEDPSFPPGAEQPYLEDSWRYVRIGRQYFQMLGPCRRCQMVCVDQTTAEKNVEPFVTLAKTRRFDGKVLFGQHTCWLHGGDGAAEAEGSIMVGNKVFAFGEGDEIHDQTLLERLKKNRK